jgi:hypothetical protein
MLEPKTPRPPTDYEDPGFAPLRGRDDLGDAEDDDTAADDLEGDYHEEGGGD